MKSLDQHNADAYERHAAIERRLNEPRKLGIACPKCGEELVNPDPNMVYTSNPPKGRCYCLACNFASYYVL